MFQLCLTTIGFDKGQEKLNVETFLQLIYVYQKLLRSSPYLDLNMKQMFIEKQYTYRVETIVSQNDGVTVYNHDSQNGSW